MNRAETVQAAMVSGPWPKAYHRAANIVINRFRQPQLSRVSHPPSIDAVLLMIP